MKLEVWTEHGPLNSKPIFEAFIKSVRDAGDQVYLNKSTNADAAVIWSVLWKGRMAGYKKIWDKYRSSNKPVIVIEVGGPEKEPQFQDRDKWHQQRCRLRKPGVR